MAFWRKLFGDSKRSNLLQEARALLAEGAVAEAIERFDAHVEQNPEDVGAWAELVRALVAVDRVDEAREIAADLEPSMPLVVLAQGEALAAAGELEAALVALATARDWYQKELHTNYHANYAQAGFRDASQLFDAIYSEVHGHEQVIVEQATRGDLDGGAGVNYRLLGNSLMVDSPHRAEMLRLESLDAMKDRLADMSAADRASARGQLINGVIALREGDGARAVTEFERAAELDGTHFAAFRGLGAAMDMRKHDVFRVARKLRVADFGPEPAMLAAVVADLEALTEIEHRITWLSVEPLKLALPALAASGCTIRIMPLDARATDYPAFADGADYRFADDHRALCALSGVAGRNFALVRLDELFSLEGAHGWVFAHEFAHLVHHRLVPERRARIVEIFERATAAGYVSGEYARSNEYEFFAMHYVDYVMRRHELRPPDERDDIGVADDMSELFDALSKDGTAFVALDPRDE